MATETTVQQGHNIKLLTLVSIFFLPLTFVTSVFGMTNMPQRDNYTDFAVVVAVVCIPFFILIGSLNTASGMKFWRAKTGAAFRSIVSFFAWLGRGGKSQEPELIKVRTFESTSSASGSKTWSLGKKTSTLQRQDARTRARTLSDLDEPNQREGERPRKVEDGPPPGRMSSQMEMEHRRPDMLATEPGVAHSRLADMMLGERDRRRRLRYREDV